MPNEYLTLEQQAQLLFDRIAGWEADTLARIGSRVYETGRLTIAQAKALNNIALVNQDINAITSELARATAYNIADLNTIYSDLLSSQHEANRPLYDYRGVTFVPLESNVYLQSIVKAYSRVTAESMLNMSKTKAIGFTDINGNFKSINETLYNVIGKSVMSVTSGATDFNSAMRSTIEQLGASGVRVNYASGVSRRLDTMVRQNLLWGAKQASVEYNNYVGNELGCDGFEVDYHSNPRPSHQFMQGKQYSYNGPKTVNGITYESGQNALIALEDYGCLHFKTPIILGVTEPRYDAQQLAEMKSKDARQLDVEGNSKTGYEWTQVMRKLETSIRQQKDIGIIAKSSGDMDLLRQSQRKIVAYQKQYNLIARDTGLEPQYDRMTVSRYTTKGRKRAI